MAETTSNTPTKNLAGARSEIAQPADDAAPPGKPDRVTAVSNLAMGSLLMAVEALDDWVDRNVPSQAQALEQLTKQQGALLPQSEWETTFGRRRTDRARLAAIGLAASANTKAVSATRFLLRASKWGAEAVRWPLDHIFLLSPLRHGVDRLADAGNERIDQWVRVGKTLDTGTRAVAEVSLGRAGQDTVGLMTVEPHIQVLIQEIIAAQGTSITKEIIREVREHSVSLDLRVDKAWVTLRARKNAQIAAPDFTVAIPDKRPNPQELAGRPYLGGGYAGIASRVLAFSIDLFALMITLVISVVFVWGIVSIFSLDRLFQSLLGTHGFGLLRVVGSGVMGTLVACVYWILGWSFLGSTVGKMVMGLRVVGPGGSRVGFWRALRRVIGYFISAFTLGLGFLWVIVNKKHHGWADKLAGTSVVYAWHARPDETFLGGSKPQDAAENAKHETDAQAVP
jgi:uncharacterized RDD family membrane protein YckC